MIRPISFLVKRYEVIKELGDCLICSGRKVPCAADFRFLPCASGSLLFVGMPGFPLLFGFSVFVHIVGTWNSFFLRFFDYRCHIVFLSSMPGRGKSTLSSNDCLKCVALPPIHDSKICLFNEEICGTPSNAQNLSNIVNRICPSFRGFFLRAVPYLRHENPLRYEKGTARICVDNITSTIIYRAVPCSSLLIEKFTIYINFQKGKVSLRTAADTVPQESH